MGEIFRRETAEHPEPFTGERLTTAIGGQMQVEHYHRYLFARSLVAGLDVLDVASGEGYGSALLAQVAGSVVGAEYSGPTVRVAAANFPRANLRFLQADARALPLADACVDAVVSFETIEHFDRQDDFVREVRRVLRSGGSFIVSTPDRDVYSPAGSAANPFHKWELSRVEFTALLRSRFRHEQVTQQRALIGSALLADTTTSALPLVFERRGDTHFEACTGLPRAIYLVAVASDGEPQPLPPSLYIERGDLDTDARHRLALAHQLQQAQTDLAQAAQRAVQAERSTVEAERVRAEAERALTEAGRRLGAERARAEADRARAEAERARAEAERAGGGGAHEGRGRERAREAERAQVEAERRSATLERTLDLLQGSLRAFLPGYLPRLRRHLFGRRR